MPEDKKENEITSDKSPLSLILDQFKEHECGENAPFDEKLLSENTPKTPEPKSFEEKKSAVLGEFMQGLSVEQIRKVRELASVYMQDRFTMKDAMKMALEELGHKNDSGKL